MAHYALRKADGTVGIMQTVGDAKPEDCLAQWPADRRAEVLEVKAVDPVDIPADRTFRNAWTLSGGKVEHDMTKAREIHKAALRKLREPLFAELDAAYLQADEAGDTAEKKRIAEKKKALRDVTDDPAIAAAETVDELKAAIPAALSGS